MILAGPLTSWFTAKAARAYMRDSTVSQPRASLGNDSHVQSFFVQDSKNEEIFSDFFSFTKERMYEVETFGAYGILRVHDRQAGPFLLFIGKNSAHRRRDPCSR